MADAEAVIPSKRNRKIAIPHVSFCGEGVKKVGPTTFRMEAKDWSPPWDRELEILILEPTQPL